MDWTTHSIKILKHGYKTGQAASYIADLLGTTKGSVVGKAHRMNFKHPGAILTIKSPKIKQPEVVHSTIGKCQYPHGHPKDAGFYFCHKQVKTNSPYCLKHHAICYRTKSQESNVANTYIKRRYLLQKMGK